MIKGFIHNFPCQSTQVECKFSHKCTKCGKINCQHVKFHLGFQDEMNRKRKIHILNELFNTILLNDKVVLLADDSFWLTSFFDLEELQKLFEANIFEIINCPLSHAVIVENKRSIDVGYSTINGCYVEHMENILSESSPTKKLNESGQNILYNIENNQLLINEKVKNEIIEETNFDLSTQKIRTNLNINSKGIKSIRKSDIIKILSLLYNNRALNFSAIIEADNIVLDSNSRKIIESKMRPSQIRRFLKRASSVEIFQDINNRKGIPNLGELFLDKIVSIEDILNLRSNIEGQLFRTWFNSNEYNKADTEKILLNNKEESVIVKYTNKVRWIIPPIVGVLGGVPTGVVASYANSKFLTKFLKGWHPNLFLDDVLRKSIERKEKSYQKNKDIQLMKKRKQKIGRNELCPCNSGRKYKRCHGKK